MTSEKKQYFTPFIWSASCDVTFLKTLNGYISSLEHDRGMAFESKIKKALLMTMVSIQLKRKINFVIFGGSLSVIITLI